MKVHGPNHTNVNPYQKQFQKQHDIKKNTQQQEDQLQISNQAKAMQNKENPLAARQAYVDGIKQQVDHGEFKPDAVETAKKIMNYWKA
ncbi:anti-sigma-28 factor [Gracilibacillus halophilus YIM-C55.5]|uniref:Negative regulator of flagellin synthesis n=1 Tax=Gracilibacillus halophilus YIM-C55.5 TaxID=1308866 RepID=N4WVG7_9BACI|nr:flagellar biosynthesis anti-sigma factor FlgM [Gracilibacillus halophilus]ENH98390.1 anti-sigma-28 factor [Gracilibacillus halophilus YIM-C55.5]